MFFSFKDVNLLGNAFQSVIQILIQNFLNHPLTLAKGLLGYAQQEVLRTAPQTTKYGINKLTDFMDAYSTSYPTHGLTHLLP